jgi:iron complex outermembrane receptor protein
VLRGGDDRYNVELSVFYNSFDSFIYEQPTGDEEDELPVFQFLQADARYYGFEVEASATLAEVGGYRIVADAVADYVRATVRNVGPVPRIPPLRLLGGLEAQGEMVDGRVEVEHVDEQSRIAAFETPTDSYTMVNASLAFRPFGREGAATFLVSANNLFDVEARRHASFLKDYAPLAGRDIRVTARLSF